MANVDFPIYVDVQGEQTSFHDLVIKKATYESVVMSLGDKITGDVYYKDNTLKCSMQEYIEYKGVKYILVSPPTIVKEGMVSDNSELKGMTKYSFVFYHPMCKLSSIPFTDVAVSSDENNYLSDSKTFTWIGKPKDFANKLNKNLQGTEWFVHLNTDSIGEDKLNMLSDVLSFDKVFISDALKTFYDTWEIPFVIDSIEAGEYTYIDEHNVVHDWYTEGKKFVIVLGLPSNQIVKSTYKFCTGVTGYNGRYYFCNKAIKVSAGLTIRVDYQTPQKPDYILRANGVSQDGDTVSPTQVGELLSVNGKYTATVDTFVVLGAGIAQTQWNYYLDEVYVFKLGKGLGLKNNSRTPKNNKIVTRIIGEGSENNIPYGYPQIKWYGTAGAKFTYGDHAGVYENVTIEGHLFDKVVSYPIYKGIVDGQYVELIKHPFTRTHLMPTVFVETLFNKVSLYHLEDGQVEVNENYDPDLTLVDYYDADDDTRFPNPINLQAPSVEMHTFEDIKPELGEKSLVSVQPYYKERENFISYDDFSDVIEDIKSWETTAAPQQNSLLDAWVSHVNNKTNTVGGEPVQVEWTGGAYTYKYTVTPRQDHVLATFTSDMLSLTYKVKYQRNYDYSEKWDDTMDENGEYKQSYFKITLPPLGFDLFACASITEAMQINMRSGACLGCTFDVYVDWEDYKRNFFDSDGNFDPVIHTTQDDGHVRDGNKYPDSTEDPITLIVKKDLETFGRLMPNEYQMPKGETTEGAEDGDEFVILGISLPLSYIEDAQDRLDEAMVEYMLENNVHYYEYPLKFDEYFLTTHAGILSQMRNNTVVRFQYGEGEESEIMDLYIKQMSVKYGSSPLPQYDITLADDIEIVLNQIGQVTDDVSRMRVQMSELQKYYYGNVSEIINSKLSKVADDVAQGRITFQQGIQVLQEAMFSGELRSSNFESGLYAGKGWRIDQLGNAELESLRVRSFLEVIELLVNRMQAQEGDMVFSDNDQIESVEPYEPKEYPCSQGDNPKSLNLYEIIDGKYKLTEDESVVEGKTYYRIIYFILSLKEKWEGYISSQVEGNILKGIINTLAAKDANVSGIKEQDCEEADGRNMYYTSWMRVIPIPSGSDITLGNNQVLVELYSDEHVPAQKNFPPCELMTVVRWGNILNPNEQGITTSEKERRMRLQRMFMLSNTEGRITKLVGVNSPILSNDNYGTTLGILPQWVLDNYATVRDRYEEGRDYLFAQGIVVEDFIKIDINHQIVPNYIDKGNWVVGQEYLATTLETHDVWYEGQGWRCIRTHTSTLANSPREGSLYWQLLVKKGEDGTSFSSKGTAQGHYANFTALQRVTKEEGDLFILDTSSDYSEQSGGETQTGFAAPTIMRYVNPPVGFVWEIERASEGDGYMVNNHLFVANDSYWSDMGNIQGAKGEKGDMGKNYYFAGDWDTTSQETFTADDFETPFFNYNGNKWVYVGDNFSNLTISEINSQKGYPQDNGNWQIMVTDFKYLIAQAIFSSFAKLGEWIFNNKYMFSAKNAGGSSTGYQNYQGMPNNNQLTSGFIPTAAFDADTGRASLSGDKVRFNPDGSGWLANKNISWKANGEATFEGIVNALGGLFKGNIQISDTNNNVIIEINKDNIPEPLSITSQKVVIGKNGIIAALNSANYFRLTNGVFELRQGTNGGLKFDVNGLGLTLWNPSAGDSGNWGGLNSSRYQHYVNGGTYNMTFDDNVLYCSGNCTIVLPKIDYKHSYLAYHTFEFTIVSRNGNVTIQKNAQEQDAHIVMSTGEQQQYVVGAFKRVNILCDTNGLIWYIHQFV